MKPEHWQQLDKLFHAALEPPVEREAFLDGECVGDPSCAEKSSAGFAQR